MFTIILQVFALIFLMSVLSRLSGSEMPKGLGRAPELAFAAIFGAVFAFVSPDVFIRLSLCNPHGCNNLVNIPVALLFAGWAYLWMETGHGTAFKMGREPWHAQSGRKQRLSPVIDALSLRLGAPLGGRLYSWLFMGLKGLLIGLAAYPVGLALAVLWPLGYEIGQIARERGFKRLEATEIGEYLTGAFAGLVLGINLFSAF